MCPRPCGVLATECEGVDLNAVDQDGKTDVQFAIDSKHWDLVLFFCRECGASMKGVNLPGPAQAGHLEIVRFLAKECEGVDLNAVDSNQRTALHLASSAGNLEMVRFLATECEPSHKPS